jgi:hypothetical protein
MNTGFDPDVLGGFDPQRLCGPEPVSSRNLGIVA